MTHTDMVREAGAVVAAAGVVLLLAPVPRVPPVPRRLAGLVLAIAAWLALASTIAPSTGALTRRLHTPVGALAAVAALIVLAGGTVVAARLVRRFPTAWFAALGLALPVRIPVPIGGETRNLLLPLYVLIAVGAVAYVTARLRGHLDAASDPQSPLDGPLAAFMGFALASGAWSVDGKEATVKIVFFYVPFVLLYLAVAAWWRHAQPLRALAWTTVGLAVPVALLAVYQYATRDIFLNVRLEQANVYSRFFRANAIFFDPNILGRYLVVAIVVLVAVAWLHPRPRVVLACAALSVPLLAGLTVTFSRSSCLMLMTALTLMAWHAFGTRRTLLVGGATLLVLGLLAVGASRNVRRVITDPQRLERVSEGRFDLIRGGVHIWERAPVHGAGLGGFERRYEETLTPSQQRRVRVVISHNTPVTVLSELGAIGFGLFVWVGLRLGWHVRDAAGRSPAGPAWVLTTLLAIVCGILMHALFYAGFFEDPYLWTLTAGAMVLVAFAPRPAPEPDPEPAEG